MRLIALLLCLACPALAEDAVGRLGAKAPDRPGHCTASLIAPDLALTAAHCVTRIRLGALNPLLGMTFFAGADTKGRPYFARVTEVIPHPKAYAGGERLNTLHDVALLRLSQPLPVPPLALALGLSGAGAPATLIGYPRDGALEQTVQAGCPTAPGRLLRIGCPVRSGQSGSPVLPEAGPDRTAIAVVVATSGGAALAVPVDAWLLTQVDAHAPAPTLP